MKVAQLQSRCECEATLRCQVTDQGQVLSGSMSARGKTESAPAMRVSSMSSSKGQLDVGFLCPFCGRNTLRVFDLKGAVFTDAS